MKLIIRNLMKYTLGLPILLILSSFLIFGIMFFLCFETTEKIIKFIILGHTNCISLIPDLTDTLFDMWQPIK